MNFVDIACLAGGSQACLCLPGATRSCIVLSPTPLTIAICMPSLLSNSVPPIKAATVSAAAYPRESPAKPWLEPLSNHSV